MSVEDRIQVELGNITRIPVDAIVNTANSSLAGGGGVDGAIHDAGGLQLAVDHGARTISFPGISTGIYGYPMEEAAEIAIREVRAFLEKHEEIDKVIFVCFSAGAERVYKKLLAHAE